MLKRASPRREFDHQILLLQGGGALGAYQAGVYEGLAEAGIIPTWIVGISIGAINSALIAGNPLERRVERLREFWDRISSYAPLTGVPWPDAVRPFVNQFSAGYAMAFGVPGFFTPRVPPAFLSWTCSPDSASVYDTLPLKETLEELVDFDLINERQVRLSLGAANVRTGSTLYFDNGDTRIGADHVRASGALPPGFPPVKIGSEYYWDGGIVSNSPLSYVWDQKPMTSALILQVDVFDAQGELPTNLDEVQERAKEIQYSSKRRMNTQQVQMLGDVRASIGRLLAKLPPELRADPDAKRLRAVCDDRDWTIALLLHQRLTHSGPTKDYEFSRATVNDLWSAGLQDVRRGAARLESIQPEEVQAGVRLLDLTKEPTSLKASLKSS